MDWLWGVRVTDGEPTMVPREFVNATSDSILYHPSSNGAACHTRLCEAVLNGIYETIERDALMVVWLARLSMPRIELTGEDPDPHSVRASLEALSFDLTYVDLTTDLGIPVTLAVLRDHQNPDFVLLDMAASLTKEARLGKINRELAQFVRPYFMDPKTFTTAATASWDPQSVKTFRDHAAFYQEPEKHRLLEFLEGSAEVRRSRDDLVDAAVSARQELDHVLRLLGAAGYEVIVIDCTHRFVERLGLHAVKVLIPGLQPVSPAYRFRVLGGKRIYELPQQLGLSDHTLSFSDLNPWPHPFW